MHSTVRCDRLAQPLALRRRRSPHHPGKMLLEGSQHAGGWRKPRIQYVSIHNLFMPLERLKSNPNRLKECSTMKTARLLREWKAHLKIDALPKPFDLRL